MSNNSHVQPTSTVDQTFTLNPTVQPSATPTTTNVMPETLTTITVTIAPIDAPPTTSHSFIPESTPSPVLAQAEIDEMKIRDHYSLEKAYTHINIQSSVQNHQISSIRQQYQISDAYELHAPNLSEKMY